MGHFRVNILVDFLNPCIKVIGCQCVCLCVTKDLASRLTDMVLLSNAVSHTPRDLNYFGGGYHHFSEKSFLEKKSPPNLVLVS